MVPIIVLVWLFLQLPSCLATFLPFAPFVSGYCLYNSPYKKDVTEHSELEFGLTKLWTLLKELCCWWLCDICIILLPFDTSHLFQDVLFVILVTWYVDLSVFKLLAIYLTFALHLFEIVIFSIWCYITDVHMLLSH